MAMLMESQREKARSRQFVTIVAIQDISLLTAQRGRARAQRLPGSIKDRVKA